MSRKLIPLMSCLLITKFDKVGIFWVSRSKYIKSEKFDEKNFISQFIYYILLKKRTIYQYGEHSSKNETFHIIYQDLKSIEVITSFMVDFKLYSYKTQ